MSSGDGGGHWLNGARYDWLDGAASRKLLDGHFGLIQHRLAVRCGCRWPSSRFFALPGKAHRSSAGPLPGRGVLVSDQRWPGSLGLATRAILLLNIKLVVSPAPPCGKPGT
jgi:hypothetical protein